MQYKENETGTINDTNDRIDSKQEDIVIPDEFLKATLKPLYTDDMEEMSETLERIRSGYAQLSLSIQKEL